MQFKHPEILYALFLLILPIIVHLFQLRRFEKVAFTNVQFLKKIALQTRKSSKLKKFLVLLTRLFLFTALIIAFAQPYFSKVTKNVEQHTFIYLDNSLSMQAKGTQGELLKRAVQDLVETNQSTNNLNLFTNDNAWYDLKNILLSLEYYPVKQELTNVLFKIKNKLKTKNNSNNPIVLISDFQKINTTNFVSKDSLINYTIIQTTPVSKSNISLDSIVISNQNSETITLKIRVKSYNADAKNVPISLYNDNLLIGKSTVNILANSSSEAEFTIPSTNNINGKVTTIDSNLPFDNELFFTINQSDKINVLAIGENSTFLSKIYTENEYNFVESKLNETDYNILSNQNLVVLNEIENIPNSLSAAIVEAVSSGTNLVIIPNKNSAISSYNSLFRDLNLGEISARNNSKLAITDISFTHPFLQNVFEKEIENFQYPTVNSSFLTNLRNSSSILKFENEKAFVSEIKTTNSTVYWLASAINSENSNFKNSPLIVPIFYNFGKYSYKNAQLNYTIGATNEIEIKASLQKDAILEISDGQTRFIPLQQVGNTSVKITTTDQPLNSGLYTIDKAGEALQHIGYNYNREESNLDYENFTENNSNTNYYTSVKEAFTTLNDTYKTNSYWQLFLVLAILFLMIEILLLKFFKP